MSDYDDSSIFDDSVELDEEDDFENNSNISQRPRVSNNLDNELDSDLEDDDDEEEEEDEKVLQKITPMMKQTMIDQYHPELKFKSVKDIEPYLHVKRNEKGIIEDEYHKTLPILTKFERTRILGERAKQLQEGSKVFVDGFEDVIDSYAIAEEELKQKVLPFIIERPLPFGKTEYWYLADLEMI